ncbi:MAG: recombinase family protein [Alsobacter sp.]
MRAVIYARYSSDQQRDASIEDQLRLSRDAARMRGWTVVGEYTDRAASGATRLRPDYQRLLEDARFGRFDMVMAEALDRLSRDQEDVAALFKQLRFAGVTLVTLAEGEISELHVGLKGTMNALFLKDLAEKTRRGLSGRVEDGRSAGGISYGYRAKRELDARGEPVRGGRVIEEAEAEVIRRIFHEFAGGRSPRDIAVALNQDGTLGPDGRTWGPSTIYGNWRRGTGLLNNELYAGVLVWNRQRFVKDPVTGKRQAKMNPPEQWVRRPVPELRIVVEDLWQAVKARQGHIREAVTEPQAVRSERARRPSYLFSHLIRCGCCGGGFSKISRDHYGCSNARNRGTCDNLLTIRRDALEESVLSGLRTHLLAPDLIATFAEEYQREVNRLAAARDAGRHQKEADLAKVGRQIRAIIEAIKEGIRTPGMKDELTALEERKAALERELADAPASAPMLHPAMAEVYGRQVAQLHEELNRPEVRAEATEILRGLIEEIRLVPENGRLEIELTGALAGILALGSNAKHPAMVNGGVQITLVAGTRNHLYRTRVAAEPRRVVRSARFV